METYSLWTGGDEDGIIFVSGSEPPKGCNGTLINKINKLEYVIYANNYEEAMQQHYNRQGWGRYTPMEEEE